MSKTASLAARGVYSSRTRESILPSNSSLSVAAFVCKEIAVSCAPLKRQIVCARGRGKGKGVVAKYKGTHMREKHLTEMIERKVKEAKEVCEADESSDGCRVAWDEVEEVSRAKAHLRVKMENQDPLHFFCQDNPLTDECLVFYEQ